MIANSVGLLAAIIGIVAFLPMIINTTITKSTYSLHYGWLFLRITAGGLWLYYGIVNKLVPNIIASSSVIFFIAYIIILKFYLESKGLAHHQTTNKKTEPEILYSAVSTVN